MTVKLNSLKVDLAAEAAGVWVEYPIWKGVAFKVRSLRYPDYIQKRDEMIKALARKAGGKPVSREEFVAKAGRLYCDEILIDWRGLDVEYSAGTAIDTLTDLAFGPVYDAVEWCAEQVGKIVPEYLEEAA